MNFFFITPPESGQRRCDFLMSDCRRSGKKPFLNKKSKFFLFVINGAAFFQKPQKHMGYELEGIGI